MPFSFRISTIAMAGSLRYCLPVELLRIEGTGIVLAAVHNARGSPLIDEVEADHIDAMPGQTACPHGRVFLGREFDGTGAPVGEMDSPKADSFSIRLHEMAAL